MLNCCKDCALHEGHVSVNKFNVYNVAKMTRGKRILSIANAKMCEHMLPQCHKNEMCALYANFKLDGRQEIANKCEMSILVAYRIHKFFSDSVLCICVCICKSCELYGNFFFYCWFFFCKCIHKYEPDNHTRAHQPHSLVLSPCSFCLNCTIMIANALKAK